ncbi:hypothetical protein Droror1_Dr00019570 [Drosera rotundifolia]
MRLDPNDLIDFCHFRGEMEVEKLHHHEVDFCHFRGEMEVEKLHHHEVEIRRICFLTLTAVILFNLMELAGRNYFSSSQLNSSTCDTGLMKEKPYGHAGEIRLGFPDHDSKHGTSLSPRASIDSNQAHMLNPHEPVATSMAEKTGKVRYPIVQSPLQRQGSTESTRAPTFIVNTAMAISPQKSYPVHSTSVKNGSLSSEGVVAEEAQSSNSLGVSEASNNSSNRSDFSMNVVDEDSEPYFQEEYCTASPLEECHDASKAITEVDSINSTSKEKCDGDEEESEEDGESDEMFGGVFTFSEEEPPCYLAFRLQGTRVLFGQLG